MGESFAAWYWLKRAEGKLASAAECMCFVCVCRWVWKCRGCCGCGSVWPSCWCVMPPSMRPYTSTWHHLGPTSRSLVSLVLAHLHPGVVLYCLLKLPRALQISFKRWKTHTYTHSWTLKHLHSKSCLKLQASTSFWVLVFHWPTMWKYCIGANWVPIGHC